MKKYILTLFCLLLIPLSVFAQEASAPTTETPNSTTPAIRKVAWNPIHIDTTLEFNFNSKQEPYVSQYLSINKNTYCGYVRFNFIKLEGAYTINAAEAAIGRKFTLNKRGQLTTYIGATTEGKILIMGGILTTIKNKPVIYAIDGKIATRVGTHSELTQKLAVFLDKPGLLKPGNTLKFKIDTLRSDNKMQYFRLGLEKSRWVSQKAMIYIGGYYDPIKNSFGIATGIRASLR